MPQGSPIATRISTPTGYHLRRSMSVLQMGRFDPSLRWAGEELMLSARFNGALVGILARKDHSTLEIALWGDERTQRHIESNPASLKAMFGIADDPGSFVPRHPKLRELARRFAGTHLPRLPSVFERLSQIILLQLVSWNEALGTYRRLVRAYGEKVPGVPLLAPPSAAQLSRLTPDELVSVGVLPRQARTLLHVARNGPQLEKIACHDEAELADWLARIPGLGRWSTAYLLGSALGDADAVLLGDYNLPSAISYLLVGEHRADDARMLELLAPYVGHRFRVTRLIWQSGVRPPRRGPRHAPRPRGW